MSRTIHAKLVIVGSGPAGYTAAIYAARAMLEPVLIQGVQPGGQLTITTDVENYPGYADVIQGPWLMEQMEKQAVHVGTRLVMDHVKDADLARRPFRLTCESGDIYVAETLVIATGAQARWLDHPSEQRFKGYGVSACATCDGFFYKGREVIVVGGGNTAVEEALFLTNFANKVTIVHRRDAFRAERILQERLFRNPKIEVIWNSVVEDIHGTENPLKVTSILLRNVKTATVTEARSWRRVHCDRSRAGNRVVPKPAGDEPLRLHQGRSLFDGNLGPRRVRGRRCRRRGLSPGRDCGRDGVHGGARSRTVPGRARGDEGRRRLAPGIREE